MDLEYVSATFYRKKPIAGFFFFPFPPSLTDDTIEITLCTPSSDPSRHALQPLQIFGTPFTAVIVSDSRLVAGWMANTI